MKKQRREKREKEVLGVLLGLYTLNKKFSMSLRFFLFFFFLVRHKREKREERQTTLTRGCGDDEG